LRHEIARYRGLPDIREHRHRLRSLDEMNANCADRCNGDGILRKANKVSAGKSAHCPVPLLVMQSAAREHDAR
jgi:hypothetical protein